MQDSARYCGDAFGCIGKSGQLWSAMGSHPAGRVRSQIIRKALQSTGNGAADGTKFLAPLQTSNIFFLRKK